MSPIKNFIKKYGFTAPTLASIPFTTVLYNELESNHGVLFPALANKQGRVRSILEVLQNSYESRTLSLIIKKIAVIYMLARKYTQKKQLDEKLAIYFQKEVNSILDNDIKAMIDHKEKKSSSLGRIYDYIRKLSGEKNRPYKSRTKIENLTEKSALKEIVSKVIQPLCGYLLKILQNPESYRSFIVQSEEGINSQMRWKMINWSRLLGEVVLELHRLSRYFTNDFQEILIFVTFLCSKDLAIYYDLIKGSIERECQAWTQAIVFKEIKGEVFSQGKLTQLKRCIEEMLNIKEKLNFIFGHKDFKKEIAHFSKPSRFKLFDETVEKQIEFVLSYKLKNQKTIKKTKSIFNRTCQTEVSIFDNSVDDSTYNKIALKRQNLKGENEVLKINCKIHERFNTQVDNRSRYDLHPRTNPILKKEPEKSTRVSICNLRKDKKVILIE